MVNFFDHHMSPVHQRLAGLELNILVDAQEDSPGTDANERCQINL